MVSIISNNKYNYKEEDLNKIFSVPDAIFLSIFALLSLKDIGAVALVNKKFCFLTNQPFLWKQLLHRDFGTLTTEENKEVEQQGPKAVYQSLIYKAAKSFFFRMKHARDIVEDPWNERFLLNLTSKMTQFQEKPNPQDVIPNSILKIDGMDVVSGLGSKGDEIPFFFRGFILKEENTGEDSLLFTTINLEQEFNTYPLRKLKRKKETLYVWEPGSAQNTLLPSEALRVKQIMKTFPLIDLTVEAVVSSSVEVTDKVEVRLFLNQKKVVFEQLDCFESRPGKLKVTVEEGSKPGSYYLIEHSKNLKEIKWEVTWSKELECYQANCLTHC